MNNMEKIDKAIEVLQAFKEGKTIECAEEFEQWEKVESYRELISLLDRDLNIRIKKQPTYRPYNSAEEFLKASKEHGPYLDGVIPIKYNIEGVFLYFDLFEVEFNFITWKGLFESGRKWQDGTPCGILEE